MSFRLADCLPKMPIAKTNDHGHRSKKRVKERKSLSVSRARGMPYHAYAIITVIVCNKEQIANVAK